MCIKRWNTLIDLYLQYSRTLWCTSIDSLQDILQKRAFFFLYETTINQHTINVYKLFRFIVSHLSKRGIFFLGGGWFIVFFSKSVKYTPCQDIYAAHIHYLIVINPSGFIQCLFISMKKSKDLYLWNALSD